MADAWSGLGAGAEGTRLERVKGSPQHNGKTFVNPMGVKNPEFWPVLKKWVKGSDHREPQNGAIPVMTRKASDFAQSPESGLRLTWFGHSSMLIEIDGHRILTDPVWGERCSPSRFMGPKRFFAPPMALEDLPPLDAVVLSHDHYDHLDEFTVRALEARKPRYLVPLGVGAHLQSFGVSDDRIVELDWWESTPVGKLQLHATPARHFSGRHLADRNATLWASWSIIGPTHRVFFSGDTGMHKDFAEIGRRLGPFDATLMESGAYDALWADVHMGPEQAVWAHQLLRGRFLFPVHWGTFNLALHSWVEPVERLIVAAEKSRVSLAIPRPGQSIEPATVNGFERWWPNVPWRSAEDSPVKSTGLEKFALSSEG